MTGPVNYAWLSRLDAAVRRLAPGGGTLATAAKVSIQTFFFQPCVYVPLFLGVSRVAGTNQRREYTTTLTSLWAFWTPIVVFAFSALPVRQQAVFFSGISLCWNALLSFLSNAPPRRLAVAGETRALESEN